MVLQIDKKAVFPGGTHSVATARYGNPPYCLRIRRVGAEEYSWTGSGAQGTRIVVRALTFENTNPWARSDRVEKFNRRRSTFPVGMLGRVLEEAQREEVGVEVEDWTWEGVEDGEIDPRLREYQRSALRAWFLRGRGIVVIPTRGGKTFVASEAIRLFLQKEAVGSVVFVTDTLSLFSQAVADIQAYFHPYTHTLPVAEIRGGRRTEEIEREIGERRVVVAMVQTLSSLIRRSRRVERWWKRGGVRMLIVDEIHDSSSPARTRLFRSARGVDRFMGLTATPWKSEGEGWNNLRLEGWTGGVVYEIGEEELRREGVLTEYGVWGVTLEWNEEVRGMDGVDWDEIRRRIVYEGERRNSVLCGIIRMTQRLGLKTLVLFSSVEHENILSARLLAEGGISLVGAISGATPSRERERVRHRFLSIPRGGLLLASGIYRKGITLPAAEVLINADEGLEKSLIVQRKGRVLGAVEGKRRSAVIDLFDIEENYLSSHSLSRIEAYVEAVGEEGVRIFDGGERWEEEMERSLREWFIVNRPRKEEEEK